MKSSESLLTSLNCQIRDANKLRYDKPVLSLILPIFNEADVIGENLKAINEFLGHAALPYEIIIYDDFSNDGTYQKINRIIAEKPNILLLRSNRRLGKGGTIKEAIKLASGEIIALMDADLSADLSYLAAFVGMVREDNPIVIGERSISDRFTQGFFRLILSLAYNTLVNLFFGTGIKDHQCGLKCFRVKEARLLINDIFNNGFVFDTELIIKARNLGIPIKVVRIIWREKRSRRNGNLHWTKNALIMMRDLFILKLRSKNILSV